MLRARDVMTTDVHTVRQDQPLEELIHMFRVSQHSGIPVVDAEGRAVGLVSETDILRALAYTLSPPTTDEHEIKPKRQRGATARLLRKNLERDVQVEAVMGQLMNRTVHDLMTPVVHSCQPDDPLASVCEALVWKEIHRIVVLGEDGKVLGLISSLDAVERFGKLLREEEARAEG